MPKRYGKLAKIMQKQAAEAEALASASQAVEIAKESAAPADSVITSLPAQSPSASANFSDERIVSVMKGVSDRLSDRGDLFKALKKMSYSIDGLSSALIGKKVQTGGNNASVDISESENENIKRDERMIELLETLVENTEPKIEKTSGKKEEPTFNVGGIITALAVGLGAIVGYVRGYVKALRMIAEAVMPEKFIAAVKNSFAKVVTFFESIGNFIGEQFTKLRKMFTFDGTSKVGEIIQGMKNAVTKFFEPIADGWKMIKEASAPVQKSIGWFGEMIGKIKSFFGGIAESLGGASKIFAGVAKIVERIALPLTIIMAIWDTVKGAIEGFEKDGIVGAISGAIKGLIESLITGPLDMLKGAISWILEAFGFEKAAEFLDSFNFSDMMKSFVDAIFSPVETVKAMFTKLMSTLENIGIPEITLLDNKLTGKVSIGPYYPFKSDKKVEPAKAGGTAPTPVSGGGDGKRASNDPRRVDAASESASSNAPKKAMPTPAEVEEIKKVAMTVTSDQSSSSTKKVESIVSEFVEGKVSKEDTIKKLSELRTSTAPALPASRVAPSEPSTGTQVASASSEAEMAKTQSAPASNIVVAPQTNVSNNSAATYAIKPPVRNPDPGMARYVSNRYAV
jgi:hypothetical protein